MPEIPAAWMEGREQKYWLVLDEDEQPIFCAGWADACHDHINNAINEYDIEGAAMWKVRQAVLVPNVEVSRNQQRPRHDE